MGQIITKNNVLEISASFMHKIQRFEKYSDLHYILEDTKRFIHSYKMKAVVRYNDPKKGIEVITIPKPKPVPGHVLIKVKASPIHPFDEILINGAMGLFPPMPEPILCGSECSGEVIEVGEGVPKEMIGKKVACAKGMPPTPATVGMWTEYALIPKENCIAVENPKLSYEDISGLFVNPLTAMGMLEVIRDEKCKSIISLAAASAVGRNLLGICIKENIDIICIVRKKEHFAPLKELGAKNILDSSDPKFEENLKVMCDKLQPTICFDPIGGSLVGKIMNYMPPKSTVYVYGGLDSTTYNGINTLNILFRGHVIKGFQTGNTRVQQNPAELMKAVAYIAKDINEGGKAFITPIAKKCKLEECKAAVAEFKKIAGKGKVIFAPN